MRFSLRQKTLCGTLLVWLLFWGFVTLRALPAYYRGTYATEGGAWLSKMWRLGFAQTVATTRDDYCVLANLCVIKAADALTRLLGHHPLAACGPDAQHTIACLYIALNFLFVFAVLRTHHGGWRALLVSIAMLLVPDLDDENRIFGEANNVGFFSGLCVVFVYYDLWLRREVSGRRLAAYLVLVAFHIFTSPLAGLVAAAFSALLVLRAAWAWQQQVMPWQRFWSVALPQLVPIVLAAGTIVRAHRRGPTAALATEAAGGSSHLWERFVEIVFARQILYPLTLNFFTWLSDPVTLTCLGIFLALVASFVVAEWKKAAGRPDWTRLSGLLLLFAVTLCLAVVTVWSRRWLIERDQSYESLWPARYYLVQTMLMTGFIALVLLRTGELFPRFRRAAVAVIVLMVLNFAALQFPHLWTYTHNPDPRIAARRWPNQLGRVHDLHMLIGDTAAGNKSAGAGLLFDVEMYIEGHSLPVPAEMMAGSFAGPGAPRPDACPLEMTDPAAMQPEGGRQWRDLVTANLRAIPRQAGVLVTFDLQLSGVSSFAARRRHLWIAAMPGQPVMRAYAYSVPAAPDRAGRRRGRRDLDNWLFKVAMWFGGPWTHQQLQQQFSGVPIMLGAHPGEGLARGTLLTPGTALPLSSLRDDETCADRLHPQRELWRWTWGLSELLAHKVTVTPTGITVDTPEAADFDETAYLRLNPDVAGALERRVLTSGRGHFAEFGRREGREICEHSVAIDLSEHELRTERLTGLRVELGRIKGALPSRVRCVFHGQEGALGAAVLVPAEGGADFIVSQMPPGFLGPPGPIRSLEVQFDGLLTGRQFRLSEVVLYESQR